MYYITATELKTNISKYLVLSESEDIIITKNGKEIAVLTNAKTHRMAALKSLRGIIRDDVSLDDIRDERLSKQ